MNVKTLCLGALTLGEASGYEIRKLFEGGPEGGPFGHFYDASYGSIYPALNQLLAEGLVGVTEMAQQGRPDKKVYHLTEQGLDVFRTALAEPPGADKIRSEYIVRLFFAEYMDDKILRSVFEDYLQQFRDMSAAIRALDNDHVTEGRKFACDLGLAFYESAIEYMEKNQETFFPARPDDDQVSVEIGNTVFAGRNR